MATRTPSARRTPWTWATASTVETCYARFVTTPRTQKRARGEGKEVVGENEYVSAARRLLRAQATRAETDALKERLLAIAGRMNRAVVGKQKREEWTREKQERRQKRELAVVKAEEKAKRRAAGEEVSSSEGGGRAREAHVSPRCR